MKFTKQAKMVLLVVLASVSILPGCGKSKNNGSSGGGSGGVIISTSGYTGGGSVASSFSVGGPVSISNASGWVYGSVHGSASAISGPVYQKTNISGDQVYLTLSGTPYVGGVGYSNVTAYVTVYLSAGSMAMCGNVSPYGVNFAGSTLVAGSPGIISNFTAVVFSNGCTVVI